MHDRVEQEAAAAGSKGMAREADAAAPAVGALEAVTAVRRPGPPVPPAASARMALPLQRAAGNRAVAAMLHAPSVQRQEPNMSMPDGSVAVAPGTAPNMSVAPDEPNMSVEQVYRITHEGQTYEIPQSEYPAFTGQLVRVMRSRVGVPIANKAAEARNLYDHFVELNNDQYIVAWIVEAVGGAELPALSTITAAEAAARRVRTALSGSDLDAAIAAVREGEATINTAVDAMREYRERVISGASFTITALEVTSTACFTIACVAGGAVLAAPVAMGGAGLGAASSGAIMGGGTALLNSAAGVGGRALAGEDVGVGDIGGVLVDGLLGAAGGAAGGALANRLAGPVTSAVYRQLPARILRMAPEEVIKQTISNMFEGGFGNALQGAIVDAANAARGNNMTVATFARNVATNLISGAFMGALQARLRPTRGPNAMSQVWGSGQSSGVTYGSYPGVPTVPQ